MNFWLSISVREKVIVIVAVIVLTILAVDTFFVQGQNGENIESKLEQAHQDLLWMQQAVTRLPDRGANLKNNRIQGRLVSYVDKQISQAGLKKSMKQMTPVNASTVRIRFADVEFDRLLGFFNQMNGAVRFDEARILPANKPGKVDASLVLVLP